MERSLKLSKFSKSIRKYSVNDYYLDIIDNQDKAYILGFLYADGYNNEKFNTIVLNLQEKDKEILEKIKDKFEYSGKLLYDIKFGRNRQNQYRLNIHNKRLSESLKLLGCGQNKTHSLKFPNFLSTELTRHFLRGFFDGDGCISYSIYKNNYFYEFSLIGTNDMILNSMKFLKEQLNLPFNLKTEYRVKNKNGSHYIKIGKITGKANMITVMEYLYKDANLKLDRKHKKFLTIKNNDQPSGRDHQKKSVLVYKNDKFFKKFESITKASTKLNISNYLIKKSIKYDTIEKNLKFKFEN